MFRFYLVCVDYRFVPLYIFFSLKYRQQAYGPIGCEFFWFSARFSRNTDRSPKHRMKFLPLGWLVVFFLRLDQKPGAFLILISWEITFITSLVLIFCVRKIHVKMGFKIFFNLVVVVSEGNGFNILHKCIGFLFVIPCRFIGVVFYWRVTVLLRLRPL